MLVTTKMILVAAPATDALFQDNFGLISAYYFRSWDGL